MAKRDPDKTARNRIIANLKKELRILLPKVLRITGRRSEASLNAIIGSKNDKFFDLNNDVIHSHEEFVNLWLQGLKRSVDRGLSPSHSWIYKNAIRHKSFKKYLLLFLKRSYLKHFEELSKNRPNPSQSEIWIGQENANYGLLVTPRFKNGEWENDKSEIRAFRQGYWTVGHVMQTGLVIPGRKKRFTFNDIDQYLLFFSETLVRNSGSRYEHEIAERYCEYVNSAKDPLSIPLLIPEFRYRGKEKRHKYRLDFLIINPYTLDKVGFELSPWSSHGYLRKTKGFTQKQINKMASDNFEKEMKKHRSYFRKHNIFCLIYTDEYLKDCNELFKNDLRPYLEPERPAIQLSFLVMEEFI